MMNIEQTSFYLKKTAFLRMPPMSGYTTFSACGFVVTAPSIAFSFARLSKNNYELTVLWHGQKFVYPYQSLSVAIEAVYKLCEKHFSEAV